jgi:hypothetical protein
MRRERTPWAPPPVELPTGADGHLRAWEKFRDAG